MSGQRLKWSESIVGGLFLWLFICGPILAGAYDFEYKKIIEVSGEAELEIINSRGNIIIEGSAEEALTITAVKHIKAADSAEAELVADHIEIKANKSGHKIHLETNFLKIDRESDSFWKKIFGSGSDSFGSIDFKITVPYYCVLDIDNTAGMITVTDMRGNIRITAASGEIGLTNIEGNLDVAATGAAVKAENITGEADIRTTTGEVAARVHGQAKVRTTSGNIELLHEAGGLEVATFSGDVNIRTMLDTSQDCTVETGSGKIEFRVPAASSGALELETASGNINTELPLTVQQFSKNKLLGKFGSGGAKIRLQTQSGDINVGQF